MIVLGIDPGTNITGYGILVDSTDPPQTLSWGTIKTNPHDSLSKRLERIHGCVTQLCCCFLPSVLAIESLFFSRNAKSTMILSHTRGVVLLAAAQANLQVVEYSPLEIKQAIVGYGRAEKSQVQHMITRLLHLPDILKEKDAADALAVALCHLHTTRLQQKFLILQNRRQNT